MTEQVLLSVAILSPIFFGVVCLLAKNHRFRALIILISALVLTINSLFLLNFVLEKGAFSVSLPAGWDTAIMIGEYIMMAYFFYIGFRYRHFLILSLMLVQAIFFSLFEFAWHGEGLAVEPVLHIDLLSVIMCLIISIIGSLICVYGINYMRDHEEHLKLARTKQHWFFFYMVMFLGAMNGVVFANNLLWLYFFWEVTTLCCFQLILHDLTPEAKESALRALWMNLIGACTCVGAVILSANYVGSILVQDILEAGAPGVLMLLPMALLCITAFTKAAQVPWQSWLLGAMVAPTPVSALLHSSTMVKAGVYLVVRLAPGFEGTYLSTAIAVFGAFVFAATAFLALSQTSAKRLLAYSTVGNLGLIIALAGINTPLAVNAAIALIIFHAISKGLMFLTVGVIEHHIWSRDIEDMEGLTGRLPVISWVAIAGMISMALMPFGVLVSKWAGLEAISSAVSPQFLGSAWMPLVLAFVVLGSVASTVFWVKWIGRLLAQAPRAEGPKVERMGVFYYSTVILLILGAVALSVTMAPLVRELVAPAGEMMGYAVPFTFEGWHLWTAFGLFAPWPLSILVALGLILPFLVIRVREEELRPVYLSGEHVGISELKFRTVGDEAVELQTGGFYVQRILGEPVLNRWVNLVGVTISLILFAVVLI